MLSDVIVETHLGGGWMDVWQHQVRWAQDHSRVEILRLSGIAGDVRDVVGPGLRQLADFASGFF